MATMGIAQLTVLLVEPSPIQKKLISGQLQSLGVGYILHEQDGAGALASIQRDRPDAVLSALYLPDMSGAELVATMRGDAQLEAVPFILVSSETNFRYLDPVRQSGAVAILPKPFAIAALKQALLATIDFLEPEALQLATGDAEDLRVLVVDDSSTARRHIIKTLRALGIEDISEACDGREAAASIEQGYFDFIVTDYNMPEMDGRELVQFIRQRSRQPALPILMVTSESDMSRLAAVEQSGAAAICDKPFEINTVRSLIHRIMAA